MRMIYIDIAAHGRPERQENRCSAASCALRRSRTGRYERLVDRRDELGRAGSQTVNRLHWLLLKSFPVEPEILSMPSTRRQGAVSDLGPWR
jgi:hypothetical protein